MAAGVYFGGTGQLPLAMTGAVLFVILGGVGLRAGPAALGLTLSRDQVLKFLIFHGWHLSRTWQSAKFQHLVSA